MNTLIEQEQKQKKAFAITVFCDISKYQIDIKKEKNKKECSYKDYSDNIISKNEYLKFKEGNSILTNLWIERLL